MELRGTRETRRNEGIARTAAKKADASAPAQARSAPRPAADRCTLSRQALSYLEQQNQLERELEERQARQRDRFGQVQDKSDELDMLSMGLKVLEACQKIAASLMKGDRVPLKDLKFLMENDPAGYKLAMALRKEKKDPEEVESVLEDEEQPACAEGEDGGGEAPAAASGGSASGGAPSGGETSGGEASGGSQAE